MCFTILLIKPLFVQFRTVPPAQPCSDVRENVCFDSIRALLSSSAKGSAAKLAGLHHRPAAWPGGGPRGLRQVRVKGKIDQLQ